MSYDKAAKIRRVPIGTVRSRLCRARQALRALMGIDQGYQDCSPSGSRRRRRVGLQPQYLSGRWSRP
jgi:hypothetical protein